MEGIQRYEQQYEQQYEQERKQTMLTFDSIDDPVYYYVDIRYFNREILGLNKKIKEELVVYIRKDIDWWYEDKENEWYNYNV